MAIQIRTVDPIGVKFEVFGDKTGKVFFTGAEIDCKKWLRNARARRNRRTRDDAMRSLGLIKVKGAMGGTYYE